MPQDKKTVVLVADDEPSTLALVSGHLRTRGYKVIEATDGDQAWELAYEHLPHVVVLDVMMPGMSGWEVCRKIREAVSLAHTGVVMLTGIGENLNEMTSPLYGADAYIDKPFDFRELDAKIRETLASRRGGTLGRPDDADKQGSADAEPTMSNGAGVLASSTAEELDSTEAAADAEPRSKPKRKPQSPGKPGLKAPKSKPKAKAKAKTATRKKAAVKASAKAAAKRGAMPKASAKTKGKAGSKKASKKAQAKRATTPKRKPVAAKSKVTSSAKKVSKPKARTGAGKRAAKSSLAARD